MKNSTNDILVKLGVSMKVPLYCPLNKVLAHTGRPIITVITPLKSFDTLYSIFTVLTSLHA